MIVHETEYKGHLAKMRLYKIVLKKQLIDDENDVSDAISEFCNLLYLFLSEHRWKYLMSNVHNKIWQYAILDTLYYPHLCHNICKCNSVAKQFIHYEPDLSIGIGNDTQRKLNLIAKYKSRFGKMPNIKFWQELNVPHNAINRNGIDSDLARMDNNSPVLHNTQNNESGTNTTPDVSYDNDFALLSRHDSFYRNGTVEQNIFQTTDIAVSDNNNDNDQVSSKIDNDSNSYITINIENVVDNNVTRCMINKNKNHNHLYKKVATTLNKKVCDIKLIFNGTTITKLDKICNVINDGDTVYVLTR